MLNFNILYKPQSIWWWGIAHSDPRQPLCEANCPNATDDDEGDDDLKQLLYECDQLPKVSSSVPSKASSVPSCVQAHFSRLLYKSLLPCPRHIWTLCKFSALCPGSLARSQLLQHRKDRMCMDPVKSPLFLNTCGRCFWDFFAKIIERNQHRPELVQITQVQITINYKSRQTIGC